MVPILETERLRLRGFREDDLPAQAAILGDPEVMRLLGQTFSREETWRRMLSASGLWVTLGYGYWAVERKEDGVFLGQVGFADFKRDMTPSIDGLPEAGWIFGRHAHGKGYAREAAAAALRWADEKLRFDESVAIINAANAPSIKLAEAVGYADRAEALYHGEPILLFRRRRASA